MVTTATKYTRLKIEDKSLWKKTRNHCINSDVSASKFVFKLIEEYFKKGEKNEEE